jgi:hypothetical protein
MLEANRSFDTAENVNEAMKYRRTGVQTSVIGQTGSWCAKRQRERRTGVSASDIRKTRIWCVGRQNGVRVYQLVI